MQQLYNDITVIILLYKENLDLIKKCLKNVKNFKVILVDNDNNIELKKNIENEFKIEKYIFTYYIFYQYLLLFFHNQLLKLLIILEVLRIGLCLNV